MNCEKARKWISDGYDGALRAGRAARLERHLRACPGCRSYRDDLTRIEEMVGAGIVPERGPDYWQDFGRRLDARLRAAAPAPCRGNVVAHVRSKWAWAGACLLVLAVVGAYLVVLRPRPLPGPVVLSAEEILTHVFSEIDSDEEFEASFNREILASIRETVAVRPEEAFLRFDDNPFVWEGMSDEELRLVETELERETGHGGQS
jgi:anti-sigma factor RsiW